MKHTTLDVETKTLQVNAKSKKAWRSALRSLASGQPGMVNGGWEMARSLYYLGLVKPVKPSTSWHPCVITELGKAVAAAMDED